MTRDEALELLECFLDQDQRQYLRNYALVRLLTGMGAGQRPDLGRPNPRRQRCQQRSYHALPRCRYPDRRAPAGNRDAHLVGDTG